MVHNLKQAVSLGLSGPTHANGTRREHNVTIEIHEETGETGQHMRQPCRLRLNFVDRMSCTRIITQIYGTAECR